MNFDEWFKENGYSNVRTRITLLNMTVEGYPNFLKDKCIQAYNEGIKNVSDSCNDKLKEKDVIIGFLKKELIHKTSFRQVMKRQYRELKQQMKADNERHSKMFAELVTENARLKKSFYVWHNQKNAPEDIPPHEDFVCNQDGIPCRYDKGTEQWLDIEGTQIKVSCWTELPVIVEPEKKSVILE